ncbi:UNVERIFIED_CONTAM: hypothetical protein FKN15_059441 [Acipenser sinensis]
MPLRSGNLTGAELHTVLLLGSLQYLQREWEHIHYFPRIYILPVGSSAAMTRAWNQA